MRVVLDTNILIGALITKGTPPDRLYQAWLRGEIELVTSTTQIAEMADVLARPRLQRFLDADEAKAIVENIGTRVSHPRRAARCESIPRSKGQPDLGCGNRREGRLDRLR